MHMVSLLRIWFQLQLNFPDSQNIMPMFNSFNLIFSFLTKYIAVLNCCTGLYLQARTDQDMLLVVIGSIIEGIRFYE